MKLENLTPPRAVHFERFRVRFDLCLVGHFERFRVRFDLEYTYIIYTLINIREDDQLFMTIETIRLHRKYIDVDSDLKLTEDQLVVMSYLELLRTRNNRVLTTMKVLSHMIPLHHKRIRQAIGEMALLGVLSVTNCNGDRSILDIRMSKYESGGFIQIPCDWLYEKRFSARGLVVYVYVATWHNQNNQNNALIGSVEYMSTMLGVSESTAKRVLQQAIDEGVVEKERGTTVVINGVPKQTPNRYKLTPEYQYWTQSVDDVLEECSSDNEWYAMDEADFAYIAKELEKIGVSDFFSSIANYNPITQEVNLNSLKIHNIIIKKC